MEKECMVSRGLKKLRRIHEEIWNRSSDGRIKEKDIELVIEDMAGMDGKTLRKYKKGLKKRDLIEKKEAGIYEVEKPEEREKELDITNTGLETFTCKVNEELKEKAEKHGLNKREIVNSALLRNLKDTREFAKESLRDDLTKNEVEFIFELFEKDLYSKKGDMKTQARRDRRRREIYKDIFEVEFVRSDESEHLEEMRKESFKLAEILGLKSKN